MQTICTTFLSAYWEVFATVDITTVELPTRAGQMMLRSICRPSIDALVGVRLRCQAAVLTL